VANKVKLLPLTADVSRETCDRLMQFTTLVEKWNPVINLVSKANLPLLWERHVVDSSQLFDLFLDESLKCADIGSGGGFPAIILAILSLEDKPTRSFILVESDQRKSAFLREAARILGLNVSVISQRITSVAPLEADVLTARAVAPLSMLLGWSIKHMSSKGFCLFPKGEAYRSELEDALNIFTFDYEVLASKTNPNGVILKIQGIHYV
jgi:16S rRNA (guanine527-N7)-methyltransferase